MTKRFNGASDVVMGIVQFSLKNGNLPKRKDFILNNELPNLEQIQKHHQSMEAAMSEAKKVLKAYPTFSKKANPNKWQNPANIRGAIANFIHNKGRKPSAKECDEACREALPTSRHVQVAGLDHLLA